MGEGLFTWDPPHVAQRSVGVQVRYKQVESLIVDDCTGGGNDTSLYKFLKKKIQA